MVLVLVFFLVVFHNFAAVSLSLYWPLFQATLRGSFLFLFCFAWKNNSSFQYHFFFPSFFFFLFLLEMPRKGAESAFFNSVFSWT